MLAITETEVSLSERKAWLKQLGLDVRHLTRQAVIAGMFAGIATLLQLAILAWVISGLLIDDLSLAELAPALAALVGVIIVRALCQFWQDNAANRASLSVRTEVRERLLNHWASQGPVALSNQAAASRTSQLLDQTEALDGYYARFQPQLQIALGVPLIILAMVFYLDWVAGLLLLFSAPLIPVFMALVGIGADKVNQQHFTSLSRLSGQFLDRVRGLTTLQLFGQTSTAMTQLADSSDRYRHLTMKTLRIAFLSSAVLEFFASVAIAMLAIYIGFGLLGYISWGPSTELTLLTGLLILLWAPEYFQPLRTLAQHYHDRAAALGAAAHLASQCQSDALTQPPTSVSSDWPKDTRLSIKDLTLSLPDRGELFNHLTASFQRGHLVVLDGPTGSGKTSLLSVLAGFRQPDRGTLSIFGEAPGARPLAWLAQKPFILFGSWRDNLTLLSPQTSDTTMLEALAQLGLTERLQQLPEGLDAAVGEGGRFLSGGQAQRLALARVLLSDLPLVLLDEPTAALDPVSAERIRHTLRQLANEGRLVIAASHDPDLIASADQVVSLGGER